MSQPWRKLPPNCARSTSPAAIGAGTGTVTWYTVTPHSNLRVHRPVAPTAAFLTVVQAAPLISSTVCAGASNCAQ